MTSPERNFDANLARSLTDLEKNRPELSAQEGSGPREIPTRAPEQQNTISDAERHAKVEEYIAQTEHFLAQTVATAEQAYKQVVERLSKNDIYSAAFRTAWDAMTAQQPYLASLENYATKAVHEAGGTAEAAQRMEAVRQRIADAEIALDEKIKLTGKAMIDGGFYERYTPGRPTGSDARVAAQKKEQVVATSEDQTVKKWGGMIGKKELPRTERTQTVPEATPVAPKKKSFWKRLFGRE